MKTNSSERTPENMLRDLVKLWVDKPRLEKKVFKERMASLKGQIEYWAFCTAQKVKVGPHPLTINPEDLREVTRDASSGNYVAVLTPEEYAFLRKKLGSSLKTPVSLTAKFGIE